MILTCTTHAQFISTTSKALELTYKARSLEIHVDVTHVEKAKTKTHETLVHVYERIISYSSYMYIYLK